MKFQLATHFITELTTFTHFLYCACEEQCRDLKFTAGIFNVEVRMIYFIALATALLSCVLDRILFKCLSVFCFVALHL